MKDHYIYYSDLTQTHTAPVPSPQDTDKRGRDSGRRRRIVYILLFAVIASITFAAVVLCTGFFPGDTPDEESTAGAPMARDDGDCTGPPAGTEI